MGNVATIAHDKWPAQSKHHPPGKKLHVMFHYDTAHMLRGTVVRNDAETPHVMIIRLDDGRYVLDGECQYSEDSPNAYHP